MDDRGGIWLPMHQLHCILEPLLTGACSLVAFERLFQGKSNRKLLKGPDRLQLVSLGAAQPRSSHVGMVKLYAVMKALKGRLSPQGKGILPGLQSLKDLRLVLPWEASCPMQWQVAEPLPANLPASTDISPRRSRTVSLNKTAPHLLQAKPLAEQLDSFQAWLTTRVQLNRDGHALASGTWHNVHCHLLHYLGFLHKHCGMCAPNLVDFLRPDLHATYLRHCIEKKTRFYASRQHVYVSSKVINWLSAQPRGGHDSLPRLICWLQRAAGQIKGSVPVPRKNVQAMTTAGTWVPAAQLINAIVRGKELALQAASQPPITLYIARDLHDAALMCCIFGYLPPPRLSCLRTCTIPSFAGPCMHPDCKERDNCHGNQLLRDAAGGGALSFYFPHHKTSIGRQHARPISFTIPTELASLLELYLQKGRPKLVSQDSHPYLFLSKSGSDLASKAGSSKLTNIFQGWMARHGCRQVSPSTCRHIFVVDRRSMPNMPGPADEDAAVVMGNSTSQWDHGIYDVSKFETAAQKGVDGMTAWRTAHQQQQHVVADASNAPFAQVQPPSASAISAEEDQLQSEAAIASDDDDLWLSMGDTDADEEDVSDADADSEDVDISALDSQDEDTNNSSR
ncbi:hypothetical protein WJX74_004022 [Apatococcus lobatus]|uniref:Tyr recombinase domain-containing protein n=1 Tax=Apatococcus lobatus TaxID=904363 RepID=A0AAW1S240_9CHLO